MCAPFLLWLCCLFLPAQEPPSFTVQVRVLKDRATPLPGIRIGIWSDQAGPLEPPLRTALSDEHGRIRVSVPGEWHPGNLEAAPPVRVAVRHDHLQRSMVTPVTVSW
ncbi:MAG: hypothetical protein R3F17_11555 [Planctomycetota bacterium]